MSMVFYVGYTCTKGKIVKFGENTPPQKKKTNKKKTTKKNKQQPPPPPYL